MNRLFKSMGIAIMVLLSIGAVLALIYYHYDRRISSAI